ncbi:MAG TPA: hypothetical protein VER11_34455 [Polyangiaceae bacterium]|nr:hypothetical protein [Polyangiaceae bacterium]
MATAHLTEHEQDQLFQERTLAFAASGVAGPSDRFNVTAPTGARENAEPLPIAEARELAESLSLRHRRQYVISLAR